LFMHSELRVIVLVCVTFFSFNG